jgi:hypothetical protein
MSAMAFLAAITPRPEGAEETSSMSKTAATEGQRATGTGALPAKGETWWADVRDPDGTSHRLQVTILKGPDKASSGAIWQVVPVDSVRKRWLPEARLVCSSAGGERPSLEEKILAEKDEAARGLQAEMSRRVANLAAGEGVKPLPAKAPKAKARRKAPRAFVVALDPVVLGSPLTAGTHVYLRSKRLAKFVRLTRTGKGVFDMFDGKTGRYTGHQNFPLSDVTSRGQRDELAAKAAKVAQPKHPKVTARRKAPEPAKAPETPARAGKVLAMPVANRFLAGDPWPEANESEWGANYDALSPRDQQLLDEAVDQATSLPGWLKSWGAGDPVDDDDDDDDDLEGTGVPLPPDTCETKGCKGEGYYLTYVEMASVCASCVAKGVGR